jgi:soluble lytic murein transglycosylase
MNLLMLMTASAAAAAQPVDPLAPITEPVSPPPKVVLPTPAPPASLPVVIAPAPVPLVVPHNWREVFAAIRGAQWPAASLGIATLPASPLAAVAKAELFTARGSPRAEAPALLALLAEAPDLPQAPQLQAMAMSRGVIAPPGASVRFPIVQIGSAPRRTRTRAISGEPEADRLRTDLEPLIKADDGAGAEALFDERQPFLSPEARAEAAQRVAWTYYASGGDSDARRVAEAGRAGSVGEWAGQAAWVDGLAAWRQSDFAAAARLFRETAARSPDASMVSAALYWAARAEQAARNPAAVAGLLSAAARNGETFYGMLARRGLGLNTALPPLPRLADARVEGLANVRRAILLQGIGERDLAGQFLRFQASLGRPGDQLALIDVARRLGLPATQHWLGHFGQPGTSVPAAARYPRPDWSPSTGWRIDPALGLAHALQESSFRAEVVSPAGAVGLMQVLPDTAALIARSKGVAVGNLLDVGTNMEWGQSWIEWMRRSPATAGQLPKVIASYNAGPLPVARWAANDRGDPLLWIESIPYWETRFYVPTVLRNMWVYQGLAGAPTPTLTQLAEHRWPVFPGRK